MVSELERMAEAAKAARIKLLNDMSVVEPRTPGEPCPWKRYILPKKRPVHWPYVLWLETAILGFVVLVIFLNALS